MQILGPHTGPTELDTLLVGPNNLSLYKSPSPPKWFLCTLHFKKHELSTSSTCPFFKETWLIFKLGSVFSWEYMKTFYKALKEPSSISSISIWTFSLKFIYLENYPWWGQQASFTFLPLLLPPTFSHFTKERLTFTHPNSHYGTLPWECKHLWENKQRGNLKYCASVKIVDDSNQDTVTNLFASRWYPILCIQQNWRRA